jgi:hypothetical protein
MVRAGGAGGGSSDPLSHRLRTFCRVVLCCCSGAQRPLQRTGWAVCGTMRTALATAARSRLCAWCLRILHSPSCPRSLSGGAVASAPHLTKPGTPSRPSITGAATPPSPSAAVPVRRWGQNAASVLNTEITRTHAGPLLTRLDAHASQAWCFRTGCLRARRSGAAAQDDVKCRCKFAIKTRVHMHTSPFIVRLVAECVSLAALRCSPRVKRQCPLHANASTEGELES